MTDGDMVPRSRLRAVEAELEAAQAKLAKVQKDAGVEIERLQKNAVMFDRARLSIAEQLENLRKVVRAVANELEEYELTEPHADELKDRLRKALTGDKQ